jgi:hypothetical protein
MKSGFEHQGHVLLSGPEYVPWFRVEVQAGSATEWVAAMENLRSKALYIEQVDWVPFAAAISNRFP